MTGLYIRSGYMAGLHVDKSMYLVYTHSLNKTLYMNSDVTSNGNQTWPLIVSNELLF